MALVMGGIDWSQPVTQTGTLLFISAFFLLGLIIIKVCIFYILREIRLLKSLMGEMKDDLKTFKKDLTRLKNLGRTKKVKR